MTRRNYDWFDWYLVEQEIECSAMGRRLLERYPELKEMFTPKTSGPCRIVLMSTPFGDDWSRWPR